MLWQALSPSPLPSKPGMFALCRLEDGPAWQIAGQSLFNQNRQQSEVSSKHDSHAGVMLDQIEDIFSFVIVDANNPSRLLDYMFQDALLRGRTQQNVADK